MSILLPTISTSAFVANTQGQLSLSATGYSADPSFFGNPAHLMVFNESGCGLLVGFGMGGNTDYLPAGGCRVYELTPGESSLNYAVLYATPNSPINTIIAVYYGPGEPVPQQQQTGLALNPYGATQLGTFVAKSVAGSSSTNSAVLGPSPSGTTLYIMGTYFSSAPLSSGADYYTWRISHVADQTNLNFDVYANSTQGAFQSVSFAPYGIPSSQATAPSTTNNGPIQSQTIAPIPANSVDYHIIIFGFYR